MTAMRIARSSSIESKTYIETRATSRRGARDAVYRTPKRVLVKETNAFFHLRRVCSNAALTLYHRFRLGANGDARMPIAIARRRSSVPGLRVSSSAGLCGLAAPRDARSDARERVRGVTDA